MDAHFFSNSSSYAGSKSVLYRSRRPASEASARGAPQSPQNARYRRYVLRHGAVRGQHHPAVRAAVYASRQGWIPHRVLHPDRAAARPAVRPQMRCEALVRRCAGNGRAVLPVHDGRQLRLRDGRPHRSVVCAAVLHPYHSHRPFFTDGGRREDVLHPVFLLCDLIGHRYADLRAAELREHPRGMEAHPVCRCDVVRRGVYSADCRSEGHEPGGSIAYHESGVGYLGYRRLAYSRSGAVRSRNFRLCADVWRYRAGTAAGTEKTERIMQKTDGETVIYRL